MSKEDDRHANRETAIQSVIEFRTCFRTASVPLSYFLRHGSTEDRIKAVDTWLLFEILNAVGGYSIL